MNLRYTPLIPIASTLLLGIADLHAEASVVTEEVRSDQSILTLLLKGGPVMIPLALCSILAVTLSFERHFYLSPRRLIPKDFLGGLREKLGSGIDAGIAYCETRGGPASRMMRAGLSRWGAGLDPVDEAMSAAASREVSSLRRSLRGLRTIAAVAPLLGLLGTVLGMIRAFQTVAFSSNSLGRPEMLAQGIYEAMVTTAVGLVIAIPVLVVVYFLSQRAERIGDLLEQTGNEFMDTAWRDRSGDQGGAA
jgi:biopolymer transport protein ExbB